MGDHGYLCGLKFDDNVVNIVRIHFVHCKNTVYGRFNNRWKFQVMSFRVRVISERILVVALLIRSPPRPSLYILCTSLVKTALTLFHVWLKCSIHASLRNSIHVWVIAVNFNSKMCNCVLFQVKVSMLIQKNAINIQYSKELKKWHPQSEQSRLAKWLFANINVSKTKKKTGWAQISSNQSEWSD